MRNIILHIATSIDGYIAGPNEEIDWLFDDGEDYGMSAFFTTIDTILWGAKTYRLGLTLGDWPFGSVKHYVFSRSMTSVSTPDTTIVATDIVNFARALKESEGKAIWLMGGAQVANELIQAGIVDRMVLSIHPVVLGAGIRLFADGGDRVQYALESTKSYDSGLVQVEYRLQ